jgi:hypothetical protein
MENRIAELWKVESEISSNVKKMISEIRWWRAYGEYVSRAHANVDAEACGYADGDEEYTQL